ncbi:MAG: alpha/beta hydrolase [Actinomycetota bacterium]|nr:alpha/beta hydrolase [Actinomycetota bacterium]
MFPGIVAHRVTTQRLTANVLERAATSSPSAVVVFVHGNVSSSFFYEATMLALPASVRALAIDLRGFGESETLPVDASRGVRDFSDDIASVLVELGVSEVHLVGWSMGGGVVMQLMLDHPELIETVTLEAPVSPFGFGGTAGAEGRRLDEVGAGTGGGGANPDFVARLNSGDTSDESPTSPRTVYRTAYVKNPDRVPHEDVWVASMLTTATGPDNYPGDSVAVDAWPGFGAGTRGVLNTMTPNHFDVSGIVDLPRKPAVLWVHGVDDAIVSDASFFDINYLGEVGVIPGWPGQEVAPAQPMITQTRAVLERYRLAGGAVTELELSDCGHAPHLDQPAAFDAALAEHIGAV